MSSYATCPAAYPTACTPASLFTALVISAFGFNQRSQKAITSLAPAPDVEYDFIVVGAGSAGCVVASRLSENPKWKVLLLEAGPEEPPLTVIPAFNRLFLHTEVDWAFQTQPSGLDRGQHVPRGRSMGGSSAINGMLYSRGNPADYDSWERMGNYGWGYKDVLPFFKKSETNHDLTSAADTKLHGRSGPLDVSHFPFRDENVPILVDAFKQTGLPFNKDHTGRVQEGTTVLQFTQRDGRRRSANRAFIMPWLKLRPNLTVQPLSPARRVIINPRTKRAVGVEFDGPHGRRIARANKEVIVSAGALQSPQILMLSGVGEREQLRAAGIATVHDLPTVGKHLKDHLTTEHTVNFTVTRTATARLDTLPQRLADYSQYLDGNHGPLSATGVRQVAAFFRTEHQDPADTRPYIHVEVIGQLTDPNGGSRCPNCTYPKEDSIWYNQLRFSPVHLHLRYAGQVRLNATAPLAKPLVYLNISLEKEEMLSWVEGFRRVAELNGTAAFREAGIILDAPPIAGCPAHVEPASDEYWECAGRLGAKTWGHLTGTCRMGVRPEDSVVDPELRVHGIRGLRVVDASVMPDLPSGNTNGPTIMIGEKGADLIKRAHCCRNSEGGAHSEDADKKAPTDKEAPAEPTAAAL